MKVAEVMTPAVDFVDTSANVQTAATRMAELDVGAVLVGSADAIEGILTDRDIIVRVVVEGLHPSEVAVRDVMTREVIGCKADEAIETAFAAMREGQFRRMPVFDEGGKPVGVVTLGDLAKNVESPEKLAETLRGISEPHRSRKAPEGEVAKTEVDAAAADTEAEPAAGPV